MTYWLVVYIMLNGAWVSGETLPGWGSLPYESEARCLESKARAEALQAELKASDPGAYEKRYRCEARR